MKKAILTVFCFLVLFFASAILSTTQAQTPTVQMTIYAGEVSTSQYGFGTTSTSIMSPGPTLTLHTGDVVNLTLVNVGTMPHSWALVDNKSSTANVLWNAHVGSASDPIQAQKSGSVVFTVGNAGNYYYICQYDGHVALGMWGNVVVESAIPEFPTTLLLVFVAILATGLAVYIKKQK